MADQDDDLTLRLKKQREARVVLESLPGFALAQVKTVDGIVALHQKDPSIQYLPYHSVERTAYCMKMLDIRAFSLIEALDAKTHAAFVISLEGTRDELWKTWSDLPLWAMSQIGQEWQRAVDSRIAYWSVEAYRKIAGLPLTFQQQNTTNTAIPNEASIRQQLIANYKSECKEKGVKVTDEMIAKAACPQWNDRTQITWWKRNDPLSKPTADRLIRRVLENKPHQKAIPQIPQKYRKPRN